MISRLRALTPMGMMVIMFLVLIGISAYNTIISNINTFESRNVAEDTNELLQSGNRTNLIISAINDTQLIIEEERRNQTERLLPLFFESFNQTARTDEAVQYISELLADVRFTEKRTADTQSAISYDLSRMRNATEEMRDLVKFLASNFNVSMLEETYREYATTQEMNQKLDRLLLNGTQP